MTKEPRHRIPEDPTASDNNLIALAQDFTRLRARSQRAWRRYSKTSDEQDAADANKAHQAWSDAVDAALAAVEAISIQQARDPADLLIQFEAIFWWVREDVNVLDGSTRRWLGRFRRSLRRLVEESR